ncbi:mCG148387 [Mus musculus]|nr:mCG148387 [Mus musculus]
MSGRQRVGDHMLRRGGERSSALLNALPGSSPLPLRLPVETSGILLQATE